MPEAIESINTIAWLKKTETKNGPRIVMREPFWSLSRKVTCLASPGPAAAPRA
jgi:hypothetical protein